MWGGRVVKLAFGVAIACLFGWLVLRHVSVADLRQVLVNVRWRWVCAALAFFLLGYAARIERWREMLVCENPTVRWRDCAGPFIASFAMNNLLPMRAGDIMRAFAFNSSLKVTSGVVIATLFVERLLDLLMIVVLLDVALRVSGADTSIVGDMSQWVLVVTSTLIALVLLFPGAFAPFLAWAGALLARLFPKFGTRIHQEILKALSTLKHLSGRGTMPKLILWSGLAWVAEGAVFYLCARALSPLITAPAAAWLALPVGTLSTLLPSTPGYVGTFDFFVVKAVTAMGNNLAASTVYAFLVHVMLWLPPTVLGGSFLMARSYFGRSSCEVRQ